MAALSITPIPAFTDNYFWLLERGGRAVVVDPGDAAPVEQVLVSRGLTLEAILVTHHHSDHIGGLAGLTARRDIPVYGPAAESPQIPQLTRRLREGDRVEALGVAFEVWEVPGHTLGHIAYVAGAPSSERFVLCGDTLFSAGCGRLFEGTAAQLHRSLARLAVLPADTRVYCTHEYTLANLAFAAAVEPDRAEVGAELARVRALRAAGEPSLPSTIGRERRINPFLRTADPVLAAAVRRHAGDALAAEVEVFAALRRWKDGFRAPR
ncbi:MAG: hydroxyacylglutathione hydrolase [Gammaproteobacteria bacterium]